MTQIPIVYQLVNAGTSPKFNNAFAKGCGGAKIVTTKTLQPGPVALWGEHDLWPMVQQAAREGRTWYYGDHAYFGRGQFFRITKNRLQVDGSYCIEGPKLDAALRRLETTRRKIPIRIEYEKPRGDFILVCPPSEKYSQRSGFTQDQWTRLVLKKLAEITNRPIVVRQKPPINRTPTPLYEAMRGAWCAVTYTSNVAIECTIAGYACITTGDSPANIFGNVGIDKVKSPFVASEFARTAWAANLCANQWTLDEIACGDAWRAIQ